MIFRSWTGIFSGGNPDRLLSSAQSCARATNLAGVPHLRVVRPAGPIPELKKCFDQRHSRRADCSNALCDFRDPAPGGNDQEGQDANDQYANHAEELGCGCHVLNLIAPWHKRKRPPKRPQGGYDTYLFLTRAGLCSCTYSRFTVKGRLVLIRDSWQGASRLMGNRNGANRTL